MKSIALFFLCGIISAQDVPLAEQPTEDAITNLGTGQPCYPEYSAIASARGKYVRANKLLGVNPSCASWPGVKQSIEKKMCYYYKKLSAKEDDDKDLSQKECGQMMQADKECSGGGGWFAQKDRKRCYCCTKDTNVDNLWLSNTMTVHQTKDCVPQDEFDKRIQAKDDAYKAMQEAVNAMRICQSNKDTMCKNNDKVSYEQWYYWLGEKVSCKSRTYIGSSYPWDRECLGAKEGAVYVAE